MNETKEKFCAPCMLGIPMALGAVGIGSSVSTSSKEEEKKNKRIIMIVSIVVLVISIALFFYLRSKSCKKCNRK
jgi:uncharacterized membrane protein AbrB (regulator of aidB expression)